MQVMPTYQEPMRDDEVIFITKRYKDLSRNYAKIINGLTITIALAMTCLIVGRNYTAHLHHAAFPKFMYLSIVAMSILVWFFLALGIYFIMIYRSFMDFKLKQKTIEPINVNYKHILEIDGKPKYYVCLWHAKHKVVEVTAADYAIINIGDQINIEYASYSKEFFSYF